MFPSWRSGDGTEVAGAVRKNQPVKVLGSGEVSVKLDVTAQKFSASAEQKIAAAGGSVTTA